MNSTLRLIPLLIALLALPILHGCGQDSGDEHGEHAEGDGHGHGETADDGHDDHDGHADDEDDEHGDDVVRLTAQQLAQAGVIIEPLGGGTLISHIALPAEVGMNQDSILHVTPRVPGIVVQVEGYLGAQVNKGDLLAVIESPELGEMKIAYLQAVQDKIIMDVELSRQETISSNTATLLGLLREKPELDELQTAVAGLRIGENKGRLLSAYAKLKAARANYARERELRENNLSTQADLLAAQESFNSSKADYFAAFEEIDFTYQLRLQEAQRAAVIAASKVGIAERRLHLLGMQENQITGITSEPDTDVARYELRAAIAGRLVSKHITPGERVSGQDSVYTIADLSTVWLNISIYTEYVSQISEGQQVVVHAGERRTTGVVEYVSAIVSEATRTVSARVVIENKNAEWKPGEFVIASVEVGQTQAARVVPLAAIQTYEGHEVIFVQDDDGIEPIQVRLGRRSEHSVEILGDEIRLGTPVVIQNSFLMKAELGKSAAGHDH